MPSGLLGPVTIRFGEFVEGPGPLEVLVLLRNSPLQAIIITLLSLLWGQALRTGNGIKGLDLKRIANFEVASAIF